MIGYSTGEAYESDMHEALGKPIDTVHPPEWKGNKEYGEVFKAMDASPNANFKTDIDWKELDMEKGPKSGTDWSPAPMVNPTMVGWNRVASNDSTMVPGAPEKPADASKSDSGTGVAHGIDRSSFRSELAKHPELVNKMASMVKGEVGLGNQEHSIVQLETAFNRAQARGHSLGQALLSVDENHKLGYYAGGRHGTYSRPASTQEIEDFRHSVLDPVLSGSNLSDRGFGPMTGNASAGVAAHQFAKGTPGYKLGQESYFNEETGKHLAALKNFPKNEYDSKGLYIDRNHDVPLAAAALDKGDGKMYGIAVDRRAPITHTIGNTTYDPAQFVYLHEGVEHPHMENLIKAGMSEEDAYAESHDAIATPTERAAVKAFAAEHGENPDKFWEQHQQYWRDVTKSAQAQPPTKAHPHTYLKPYAKPLRAQMEQAKTTLQQRSLAR